MSRNKEDYHDEEIPAKPGFFPVQIIDDAIEKLRPCVQPSQENGERDVRAENTTM
ncbi:MAG: hypothetical protein HQK96_04435 [Nitrospirae bacterium]|nr:hypothetical protein [Nitrospirota bacterium]